MCWSVESSLISAAIFAIGIAIVWYLNPKQKTSFFLFFGFYGIMQLLQALIWFSGEVTDTIGSFSVSGYCSLANRYFTYAANVLIWTQPALFATFGFLVHKTIPHLKLLLLYLVFFLVFFGYTVYNTETQASHLIWNWPLRDSNFGPTTCTLIGSHGYMLWIFGAGRVDFQPTWVVYATLILIPLVCLYNDRSLSIISFSWWFTYLISRFLLPLGHGESTAFWCTLSVISVPIVVVYSFYEYKTREIEDAKATIMSNMRREEYSGEINL